MNPNMINFLIKLFGIRKEEKINLLKPLPENDVFDNEFEWYLKREIENCKFIKKEGHALILGHFLKKKDILKTQNKG